MRVSSGLEVVSVVLVFQLVHHRVPSRTPYKAIFVSCDTNQEI
jgi:hypothetical protein